jgi:hypothetical protein
LKAAAAGECGFASWGQMGPWGWTVKGSFPAQVVPTLIGWPDIPWKSFHVMLVPDFDIRRNPLVNLGFVMQAEAMYRLGADVHLASVPPIIDAKGRWLKKGAPDDFLQYHSAKDLWEWAMSKMVSTDEPIALDRWRQQMLDNRRSALLGPGIIYLDRSPMGAGKSHADLQIMAERPDLKAILTVPTHQNCHQVEAEGRKFGLNVIPRPDLRKTCQNEEGLLAQREGFNVAMTVCPECPYADGCEFKEGMRVAGEAQLSSSTNKRLERTMVLLTDAIQVLFVHEDVLDTFCPTITAGNAFAPVRDLARETAKRCKRDIEVSFFANMAAIADNLHRRVNDTTRDRTYPIPLPGTGLVPFNVDGPLWTTKKATGIETTPDDLCLVRDLAKGLIELLYHQVGVLNPRKGTKGSTAAGGIADGEEGVVLLHHTIMARYRCQLPEHLVTIVNDATATRERLQTATGREVVGITPSGVLERKKYLVQVPVDVTRKTTVTAAAKILRGIVYDLTTFRHYKRLGVLTHQKSAKKLPKVLGEPFAGAVVKWSYFGSGESRGSNDWMDACDCLIILGTPRFGPNIIGNHLLRLGNLRAGSLTNAETGWPTEKNGNCQDAWLGKTESGRRVVVRTPHYTDHDWHRAYCDSVVAELWQSIGRARSLLGNGIDCVVVSTEFLGPYEDGIDGKRGVPISDWPYSPLSKAQWRVLEAMGDGDEICVTKWLSQRLGIIPQRVRKLLGEMVAQGRVAKVGQRGGWKRLAHPYNATVPYDNTIGNCSVSTAELEADPAEADAEDDSGDDWAEPFTDEEVEYDYDAQDGIEDP